MVNLPEDGVVRGGLVWGGWCACARAPLAGGKRQRRLSVVQGSSHRGAWVRREVGEPLGDALDSLRKVLQDARGMRGCGGRHLRSGPQLLDDEGKRSEREEDPNNVEPPAAFA